VAITFRRVSLSKNAIQFGRRVDPRAVGDFIVVLDDALSRGHHRLILDVRKSERAYSSAVLPPISLVEERRRLGTEFALILPTDQMLSRLFVNANWAYLLDPSQSESPQGCRTASCLPPRPGRGSARSPGGECPGR
jgi:hypothetical protein